MIQGDFSKSFSNGYKLIVYWESTLNPDANSSTMVVWAQLYVPYSLYIGARTGNTIKLDNTTYSFDTIAISNDGGTPYYEPIIYESFVFDVSHNADGTKNVTLSVSFNLKATISGTYYGTITATDTIELEANPIKASITSAPNFTDEDNPVIEYSNPAGDAATELQACISFTGDNDDIPYRDISKTGSSYTFNFTDEERAILRRAVTSGETKQVYFYARTVVGGASYTQRLQKTLTLVNHKPTLAPTVEDTNAETLALTGDAETLIRSYSDVVVSTGAAARKEATIASQSIVCGAHTINAASGTIENVESGTFVFSVTDSRGFTISETVTKQLVEYIPLTCDLVTEPPTLDGVIKFTVSGNCFSGSFGAVSNTLTILVRYKAASGEYGDWASVPVEITSNNYSAEMTLTIPDFDYRSSYTLQARSEDKLQAVDSVERTVLATPIFDWGSEDFNINGELHLNGKTALRSTDENKVVLSAEEADIYLRPNGSTTDAGQLRLTTTGAAYLDGVKVATVNDIVTPVDYIIEYGDNGSYAYRKWYSGKLEAWRTATSSVSITFDSTAYGSTYYNTTAASLSTNGEASQFVTIQDVQLTLQSNAGAPIPSIRTIKVEDGAAKISYHVFNPIKVTLTITPKVHIIGTWK